LVAGSWGNRRAARLRSSPVLTPTTGDDWLALTSDELPISAAYTWAVRPDCGAVVLFSGTARDHAEGRTGVVELQYEAYEEQVLPRLERLAAELRARWPAVGRVVMLHRIGPLAVGVSSVVVVVSSPHRAEAFDAARFGIDTLKSTLPVWKKEVTVAGDSGWALAATDIGDVGTAVRAGQRD
jgi:molybdopterin synthase catalytic subunit